MAVIEFPQGSRCYACFDFTACGEHTCPACNRSIGVRLPPEKRPERPAPIFIQDTPND